MLVADAGRRVVVAAMAGHCDDTLRSVKRTLTSLLLAAVLLATAATAAAQNPIDDYRRNGTIDPCKYSDGQLRKGVGNLPPDVEQYAPGLADQLNAGRQGCGGGAPGGTETRQTEAVPGAGVRRRRRQRRRPGSGAAARTAAGQGTALARWSASASASANFSTPAVSSQAGRGRAGLGAAAAAGRARQSRPWWPRCGSPGRTPHA